jgi:hypothetical protein
MEIIEDQIPFHQAVFEDTSLTAEVKAATPLEVQP